MPDNPRTPQESHDYGRSLREHAPLESHAEWSPESSRPDPVKLIEQQNENRVPWLVPVRRVRMAVSPFTFYRGSARIMAADLARTPISGIETQICGDAHLSNFGVYASPERRLVFDLNDFDETLPGPWEWDVKRLTASFILAGRHNGLSKKESSKVAQTVVRTYRKAMTRLATMRLTDIWYSLVEVDQIRKLVEDKDIRKDASKEVEKATQKDSRHALDKLAEEVDGKYRIRSEPPVLIPLRDLPHGSSGQSTLRSRSSAWGVSAHDVLSCFSKAAIAATPFFCRSSRPTSRCSKNNCHRVATRIRAGVSSKASA